MVEAAGSPSPRRSPRPRWSYHPLSALLLAATDVVAGGGDLAAIGTGGWGYLLVLLVACGASAAILGIETFAERRFLRAAVKALVAWVLIVVPTPIAGLVGASASLGARLLGPRERA